MPWLAFGPDFFPTLHHMFEQLELYLPPWMLKVTKAVVSTLNFVINRSRICKFYKPSNLRSVGDARHFQEDDSECKPRQQPK